MKILENIHVSFAIFHAWFFLSPSYSVRSQVELPMFLQFPLKKQKYHFFSSDSPTFQIYRRWFSLFFPIFYPRRYMEKMEHIIDWFLIWVYIPYFPLFSYFPWFSWFFPYFTPHFPMEKWPFHLGCPVGAHLARLPAAQRHHDVAAADQLRSRHQRHDQRCLQGERRCHGAIGCGFCGEISMVSWEEEFTMENMG